MPGWDSTPVEEALGISDWRAVGDGPTILAAPRQHSTLWLKVEVVNSTDEPIRRWLEFSPWRLNRVDAWLLDPITHEIKEQWQSGLEVPLPERSVESAKTLIPVWLLPDERRLLVLRIHSDSRPFLDIHGWDPVDFAMQEGVTHQRYHIMLAGILTLFAVLLLQLNMRYALLGAWLLVAFVFESQKDGYISLVLFTPLADYSRELAFSTWILTEALFVTASVYLLGLNQHRHWRWLVPGVMTVAVLYMPLVFVLDGVAIRHLGSAIDLSYSLAWLLMVPAALKVRQSWQFWVLSLLSLWWIISNFILLGYIFNFHYTGSFVTAKIAVEVFVILSLLLLYAVQKRAQERDLERQLRRQEREQRQSLERAVEERTRELNQAVDEARKANAAKTDFLGRITHDLKSPLTSIIGYAQLLGAEKGHVGEMSQIIHGSASHMHNLINQLIDYARGVGVDSTGTRDLYLYSFLAGIQHEARMLARRNGNTFHLSVAPGICSTVHCHETSLRQILMNLIDNAAKSTHQGEIALHAWCVPASGDDAVRLMFELRDTGCGIPKEARERLFEPFVRGDGRSEGLGLGLSIVKELVDRMGGCLALESEEGQGTTLRLDLPMVLGREQDSRDAVVDVPAHVLPEVHAHGLAVWVVEDSAPIRELLTVELTGMGCEVRAFPDAESTIAALSVSTPGDVRPNLVMTDHRLPGGSGDAVLQAVQRRCPAVPVILLSATWNVLHEPAEQARSGYAACLGKPVNLATLRRALARICGLAITEPAEFPGEAGASPANTNVSFDQLEQMLTLGAVTDIIEWCQALSSQHPEQATFAAEIRRLAERGDFEAIAARL